MAAERERPLEEQIQASLDQASDAADSSDNEDEEEEAAAFLDAQTRAGPEEGPDDELFHDARSAPPGARLASPTSTGATPDPESPPLDESDATAEPSPLQRRQTAEAALTPAQREERQKQALELKQSGNAAYLASQNVEAVTLYSEALAVCPLCFTDDRAVLLANRAAAHFKQGDLEATIQDCSESLELKPDYLKALVRRAQAYEDHDKPHEALKDFEKVLTLDPKHAQANVAARVRLPEKVKVKDEQLKAEMMTNLKKLGNMVLNPFGLSTENFQFVQDPESGNYSVNFSQNNKS